MFLLQYCLLLLLQEICHRDLKLENTLLDGSPMPRLKICDFGYSKVKNVLVGIRFSSEKLWQYFLLQNFAVLFIVLLCFGILFSNFFFVLIFFFVSLPITVCFVALTTQISSWNSSIHCPWGPVAKGVWWKGTACIVLYHNQMWPHLAFTRSHIVTHVVHITCGFICR